MQPNDIGNPSVGAWTLIQQLETKVREKNLIIEDLKEESNDWRRKFILIQLVGKGHPFLIGMLPFLVGICVGTIPGALFVLWLVRR